MKETRYITRIHELAPGVVVTTEVTEYGHDHPDTMDEPGGWEVDNWTLDGATLDAVGTKIDLLQGCRTNLGAIGWLDANHRDRAGLVWACLDEGKVTNQTIEAGGRAWKREIA